MKIQDIINRFGWSNTQAQIEELIESENPVVVLELLSWGDCDDEYCIYIDAKVRERSNGQEYVDIYTFKATDLKRALLVDEQDRAELNAAS